VGKGGRCVRLTTLPPSCAVVMKSGNLNFLEPSGPLQACIGTASYVVGERDIVLFRKSGVQFPFCFLVLYQPDLYLVCFSYFHIYQGLM